MRNVNVSLTWEPPIFTDGGKDIIKYKLHYRKEPPSTEAHKLEPDKGTRDIDEPVSNYCTDGHHWLDSILNDLPCVIPKNLDKMLNDSLCCSYTNNWGSFYQTSYERF